MDVKKCSKCKKVQDIAYFCKNKTRKDGFHTECRACRTERYHKTAWKLFPKVLCSCGESVTKYYLTEHQNTNIHKLKLLNNNVIAIA